MKILLVEQQSYKIHFFSNTIELSIVSGFEYCYNSYSVFLTSANRKVKGIYTRIYTNYWATLGYV